MRHFSEKKVSREAFKCCRDPGFKVPVSLCPNAHTHEFYVLTFFNIGLLLCNDFSFISCALLFKFWCQNQMRSVCLCRGSRRLLAPCRCLMELALVAGEQLQLCP